MFSASATAFLVLIIRPCSTSLQHEIRVGRLPGMMSASGDDDKRWRRNAVPARRMGCVDFRVAEIAAICTAPELG
ncbi:MULTISPECIES: hypothetical protein [Bradyrhizobium]|jgi:hypothetical protein|uniref:Secreted protein n=1 Tax=Bradyrhizobium denitrificans TaxID=2734912 RepID=A0ABS5FZA0_9BRAD|nr:MULTISPECIES: hypothetical protein [Bradyrhizobium]MBR1134376.1 hypothetical protein [Bradyrhizobium denitrificans]MDU0954384.1 hypothetical protein [Bradyrhizobium sp.]MDU1491154.1 hypothetical protein [Bradyrhizobium sp.]MDU1541332.1 hypothetical protein [Bradyrhizobium sp.]MDU1805283.1 hypothetical protein [Bradyrhizobium sp.]